MIGRNGQRLKKLASAIILVFIGSLGLTIGLGIAIDMFLLHQRDGLTPLLEAVIPVATFIVSLIAIIIGGEQIRELTYELKTRIV